MKETYQPNDKHQGRPVVQPLTTKTGQSGCDDRRKKVRGPVLIMDSRFCWVVCAANFTIVLLASSFGRGLAIVFMDIVGKFGTSITTTSLSFTLQLISISIASMLTTSLVVPVTGERVAATLGSLGGALCTIGISLAPNITVFLIFMAVKGFCLGLTFVPAISMISMYFNKRRSLATSLANCGLSVGSMITPTIVELLMGMYGLQGTFLIIAALELHAVPASMLLRPMCRYSAVLESKDELHEDSEGPDVEECDRNYEADSHHALLSNGKIVNVSQIEMNGTLEGCEATKIEEHENNDYPAPEIEILPETDAKIQNDLQDRHPNEGDTYPTCIIPHDEKEIKESQKSFSDVHNENELPHTPTGNRHAMPLTERKSNGPVARSVSVTNGDMTQHSPAVSSKNTRNLPRPELIAQHSVDAKTKQLHGSRPPILNQSLSHSSCGPKEQTDSCEHDYELSQFRGSSSLANTKKAHEFVSAKSGLNHEGGPDGEGLQTMKFHASSWSMVSSPIHDFAVDTEICALEAHNRAKQAAQNEEEDDCYRQLETAKADKTNTSCWKKVWIVLGTTFNLKLLRSWSMRCLLLSAVTGVVVQYLVTYLPTVAIRQGIPDDELALILTVGAAVDLGSRILIGAFTDMKVLTPTQIVAICQVTIGTVCHFTYYYTTFETLMFLSIMTGLFGGTRQSLGTLLTIQFMGMQRFLKALGLQAMVGPMSIAVHHPILSSILEATGSFAPPLHYVGVAMYISSIFLLLEPVSKRLDVKYGTFA